MQTETVTISPELQQLLGGQSLANWVYDLAGLEPPQAASRLSFELDCLPGVPCYLWADEIGGKYVALCSLHSSLKAIANDSESAKQLLGAMAADLLRLREPSRMELRTAQTALASERLMLAQPLKGNSTAWLKSLASLGLDKEQSDTIWLAACSIALQSDIVDLTSKAGLHFQADLCAHGHAWEQRLMSEAAQITTTFVARMRQAELAGEATDT